MAKFITVYLIIILFSQDAFGKNLSMQNEYVFKQITVEEGLSQSAIFSIIQDKMGYMWFGTGNGLNKYDGYNFTIYINNPLDSTSISDNGISAIYEDKEGFLWIGTTGGILNKFNRNTETFEHFELHIQENIPIEEPHFYDYPISFSRNNNLSITSIAEDDKEKLWIGTWGGGLFEFDKKTGKTNHYYHNPSDPQSLSYNGITSILVDSKGTIWISTFGGGLNRIVRLDDSFHKSNSYSSYIKFAHYRSSKTNKFSLSDDNVISLFEDNNKTLWVGTYKGGLNRLNNDQKFLSNEDVRFQYYKKDITNPNSLANNTVMSITGDKSCLWIGTFGGGLSRLDLKTLTFTNLTNDPLNENSLSDNEVYVLYRDKSGILWIGTHLGRGISKLQVNMKKFNHITKQLSGPNSLSDNVVWSIFEDSRGYLWIGTYRGGMNRYDRGKNNFVVYKCNPDNPLGLSDNHIRVIKEDRLGNLWIGTYSQGLNKFNPATGKFKQYKNEKNNKNSIGSNQVQDIYIDKNSTFWIATFGGGLNKFKNINDDNISFDKYVHNPSDPFSISSNRVYTIFEDKAGILWIGTFGGGLNQFDRNSGKFISYKNDPDNPFSISSDRIMTMYEDTEGNLWCGTFGGGLNRFDRETKKFFRYLDKDGLLSNTVYGILEDDNKNLWMSTDNGIFKYNILSKTFTGYDLNDGLQSLEFNGGAYFKSKKGEMFFGGINGFNYFYPDSIKYNTYVPDVVINSFRIFNQKIKGEKKEITLSYKENFFSFEFAALDYSNPEDNQYAYMLEGFDTDWHYTDASLRQAVYTNLPTGEYTFRVRASNNDGVWNDKGVYLKLTILPPFWQTWWFITGSIMIILFIVYYLSTTRIKNLLALERLKTKLAADLHDNIGSGLTEISILSELTAREVEKYPGNSSGNLKTISETASKLIDSMSDIVWVVNPKRDSLHDLILRIKDSYSEMLSFIGISFKTDNIEKLDEIKLPMTYRQNLYSMLKEGINNCIKHSKCTEINLKVNVKGDTIEINLEDNGIGLNGANLSLGNGLSNIETRANSIGGSIKWESSPNGGGTSMRFVGKLSGANKIKNLFLHRG
jgi:ligand-binding sensor domain-containing protein/two-component sensor histidine kinase